MRIEDIPQKAGFYWARVRNAYTKSTMLAITGEAPFFRIHAWHYPYDRIEMDISIHDIHEIGPIMPEEGSELKENSKEYEGKIIKRQ